MKELSQTDKIIQHLIDHGSITSMEAIQKYGCTRLASRIWDAKKVLDGKYDIVGTMVTRGNKRYKKYRLEKII